MADLADGNNPLYAFAVDMLSAAVVMNTLGTDDIRPSGTVLESTTYGFVMNNATANLPATLYETGIQMPLAECMDLLTRAGPVEFSKLVYFRGVDSYMAFQVNENLRDQELQATVSSQAMSTTQYAAPVVALGTVVLAFFVDVLFLRRRRFANVQSRYNELKNDANTAGNTGRSNSSTGQSYEIRNAFGSHNSGEAGSNTHGNTHPEEDEDLRSSSLEMVPLHGYDAEEKLDYFGEDNISDDDYSFPMETRA